jgi:3D (Asp-Asp-Asp) domain-containing protein
LRAVVSARTSLLGIAVTDRCAGAVSVVLSIASRAGTALVTARARSAAALTAIVARVTAALMTSRASVLAAVATAGFGAAAVFVWTRGLLRATYRGVGRSISEFRAAIERTVRSYAARVSHTIARARASVIDRYVKTRDSLVLLVTRIVDRVDRAYRAAAAFYGEVKRQATRQVLPDAATPVIAAALVCMVLFVFGINSYFIINDVERKGDFFDSSRHDWGDEALASMLIGEGYDIYLQKKITDKRIKELLATGKYYERVIRVTGYYSPLPDQNKYATGSYRGDIILNGRGIMGSDTTPVYMGMAAGPPHLEYGTNIIIEDLGKFNLPKIYTVHDRGGAINGNRLDIWVGKGEEAMKKAYEITGYYKVIVVGDK